MRRIYLSWQGRFFIILLLFVLVSSAGVFTMPTAAQTGLTWTVDTTEDLYDDNIGDGICGNGPGTCSIRAALLEANKTDPVDTIIIPAGIYTITRLAPSPEDFNVTGDFDIFRSVNIEGAGAEQTIIVGDTQDNVFHVIGPSIAITVNISNLTITGDQQNFATNVLVSSASANPSQISTVNLTGVELNSNRRGLSILIGNVKLENSKVLQNVNQGSTVAGQTSPSTGGGIYNAGKLLVINSEIRGNQSNSGTAANNFGNGGGIYNQGDLTVTGSLLLENSAAKNGGGIYNRGTGLVDINTTKIRDNLAGLTTTIALYGSGGGLFNEGNDNVNLNLVEITDNQADSGGGIRNSGGGTILLEYSLIANNFATNPPDTDVKPNDFNPVFGGGGIDNTGANNLISVMTINRSVIDGNTAAAGGGILNYSKGEMIIRDTTISFNNALTSVRAAQGGGIYNGYTGTLTSNMTLENVTISSNVADSQSFATGEGAGIWTFAPMTLRNVTIARNDGQAGGGLFINNNAAKGSVRVFNTVFSLNDASVNAPDCFDLAEGIDSQGNNVLINANTCVGFRQGVPGDKPDVDGKVGELLDNGGYVIANGSVIKTHGIPSDSPAVNNGNPATCTVLDQRGFVRDAVCDSGAVEYNSVGTPTPTSTGTVTAIPPTATFTPTGTSTFTPSPTRTPTYTFTPGGPTVEPATATPTFTASSTYTPGGPTITPEPPTSTSTLDPNTTATPITPTATGTQGGMGQEVLINGGFETSAGNGKVPDNWKDSRLSKDKRSCNKLDRPDDKPDKIVAHSGECAFEFKGLPGENSKITQTVGFEVIEDFTAGDVFILSAWVEKKDLKDGGKLQAKFKYSNRDLGDDGKDKIKLEIPKGTGAYEQIVSTSLMLAGRIKDLKVQISYKGTSGKMYVDDVSLARNGTVSQATATPSPAATSTVETGATGTPSGEGEVIVNGGFEANANDDKEPDNWTGSKLTEDKHVCNDGDETVAHTGECAFQFKGVNGENSKLSQTLDFGLTDDFKNGDTFNLSAWVETKGLKDGAKIQVIFKYINDNAGDNGQDKIVIEVPKGDGDYTQLTGVPLTLVTRVTKVKVQISYKGSSGRMYVDDVSLLRTPASARSDSELLPLP